MAAELAGLALLLCAGAAAAQQPASPALPPTPMPAVLSTPLPPPADGPPTAMTPKKAEGGEPAQEHLLPLLLPEPDYPRPAPVPVKERPPQQAPVARASVPQPRPMPAALPPSADVQPAALQQRNLDLGPVPFVEPSLDYTIPLTPPGPERLFRMETEQDLKERMRQEAHNRGERDPLVFPDEPVLTTEPYAGRNWPERKLLVEPDYVCYNRLLYEQLNLERYGWDIGPLQVPLAVAKFYLDTLFLPYNQWTDPCRSETSAGYCLPGDSVPFLLYPPEWSLTGAIAEAGVGVALFAMFP